MPDIYKEVKGGEDRGAQNAHMVVVWHGRIQDDKRAKSGVKA